MALGSTNAYRRLYNAALGLRNRNRLTRRIAAGVNSVLRLHPPTTFSGWGMTTQHQLPWVDEHRWATFRETLSILRDLEYTGEAGISADSVDSLAWRHWVVAYAIDLAMTTVPRHDAVTAVECGVADGTTALVVARELDRIEQNRGTAWHLDLYDSWGTMPEKALLESERQQRGRYSGLSLEATKRNLAAFSDHCTFHVGYVPAAFDVAPELPDEVAFLHVDLNAAMPTLACCEHVWPRLVDGGVILFDDYAWLGFEDTKRVVDDFFADKPGSMLKWPTGQAMFIRASGGRS